LEAFNPKGFEGVIHRKEEGGKHLKKKALKERPKGRLPRMATWPRNPNLIK